MSKNKDPNLNKQNGFDDSFKKHIGQRISYGIMMGISDGIPGYSGGTTLSLVNFYEVFIDKMKKIFKPFDKNVWWRNILWVLPFLLFWVISLLAFSYFSNFIASGEIFGKKILTDGGYPIVLIITFALFSLFSIPLFVMSNKPEIVYLENQRLIAKKTNWTNLVLFIIGFLLILAIGLVVFFVRDGISLATNDKVSSKNELLYDAGTLLMVCVSMLLAGFAMLIPGISGSMVLYMFGTYKDIFWVVLKHPITNIGYVFICGLCAVAGILLCIFSTSWLIKKFKSQYYAFCFGMVCSSFIAILLAGKKYFYSFATQTEVVVPLFFLAIIIVLIVNAFLFSYIKKTQKINSQEGLHE